MIRNVFCDHASASDDNAASNGHAGHDLNAAAKPNIISHPDGIGIFKAHVPPLRINRVSRRIKAAIRPNKHVISECDLGAIQYDKVMIGVKVFSDLNIVSVVTPEGSCHTKRPFCFSKQPFK